MRRSRLNNKLRKAFHGRSRGFTLVEVLITIALIGAVGVAFMTAMSAISSALIRADQRTIAESLARSQMEFIKIQSYNITINATPGGVATATYLKIPNLAQIAPGFSIGSVTSINGTWRHVNWGNHEPVVAVAWNTTTNSTAIRDTGLQRIALLIRREGSGDMWIFVSTDPRWAYRLHITLEGYKSRE